MMPSTQSERLRAMSGIDSRSPSRPLSVPSITGQPPSFRTATSNVTRVRREGFSKMRTTFWPLNAGGMNDERSSLPRFSSASRSRRVRSSIARKCANAYVCITMHNYACRAPGQSIPFCYNSRRMKRLRHQAIIELVKSGKIASQDDLMRGLRARHIDVSQSTLSRDIQELGLGKAVGVYVVGEGGGARANEE